MDIYKVFFEKLYTMGLFLGAAHGLGDQKAALPKECLAHPKMMTRGRVIDMFINIKPIFEVLCN